MSRHSLPKANVIELAAFQTCRICVAGTPDWEPNPVEVTCWCGAVACLRCMDAWHWRYYDDCKARRAS